MAVDVLAKSGRLGDGRDGSGCSHVPDTFSDSEQGDMASVTHRKEVQQAIAGAVAIAQQSRKFSASKLWLDFDEQADVLYISLKHPQDATETIDLEDQGILLRYRGKELVGITVLGVSER